MSGLKFKFVCNSNSRSGFPSEVFPVPCDARPGWSLTRGWRFVLSRARLSDADALYPACTRPCPLHRARRWSTSRPFRRSVLWRTSWLSCELRSLRSYRPRRGAHARLRVKCTHVSPRRGAHAHTSLSLSLYTLYLTPLMSEMSPYTRYLQELSTPSVHFSVMWSFSSSCSSSSTSSCTSTSSTPSTSSPRPRHAQEHFCY